MENQQSIDQELLLTVKMEEDTNELSTKLASLSRVDLEKLLNNENAKKAFWINIYNAQFQILRKEGHARPEIFRKKLSSIGDLLLSLDDIEHGILRRYRWKLSKGYLPNPFASSTIKELAVKKLDFRIHFALNCGARSCPPIAFYDAERLDSQLEMATLSFLESETTIDEDKNQVHSSALFSWFAADFGSKKGSLKILSQYLKKDLSKFDLHFKKYSWEEDLGRFEH